MTREDRINQAWARGYEAGLSGKHVPCPYDTPWLYGPWISGYAAGGQDRRSAPVELSGSSRSQPGCDGFAVTAGVQPSAARAA